jgi:hypothetical protein
MKNIALPPYSSFILYNYMGISCIFFEAQVFPYTVINLHHIALVPLPPDKFVSPPFCYQQRHEVGVASTDMTYIQNESELRLD